MGGQGQGPATRDTPHTLRVRASLAVDSLALVLVGPGPGSSTAGGTGASGAGLGGHQAPGSAPRAHGASPPSWQHGAGPAVVVARASLERLGAELRMFPSTTAVSLRIGAAGVDSPHGRLFESGVLSSAAAAAAAAAAATAAGTTGAGPSPTAAAAAAHAPVGPLTAALQAAIAGQAAAGPGVKLLPAHRHALTLDFTKAPQDGAADAVVTLFVAPSFVTYNAQALAEVQAFLTPQRSRELVALQVGHS